MICNVCENECSAIKMKFGKVVVLVLSLANFCEQNVSPQIVSHCFMLCTFSHEFMSSFDPLVSGVQLADSELSQRVRSSGAWAKASDSASAGWSWTRSTAASLWAATTEAVQQQLHEPQQEQQEQQDQQQQEQEQEQEQQQEQEQEQQQQQHQVHEWEGELQPQQQQQNRMDESVSADGVVVAADDVVGDLMQWDNTPNLTPTTAAAATTTTGTATETVRDDSVAAVAAGVGSGWDDAEFDDFLSSPLDQPTTTTTTATTAIESLPSPSPPSTATAEAPTATAVTAPLPLSPSDTPTVNNNNNNNNNSVTDNSVGDDFFAGFGV